VGRWLRTAKKNGNTSNNRREAAQSLLGLPRYANRGAQRKRTGEMEELRAKTWGVVHVRGVWWDPVIVGESGEVRRLVGKKTNASYNKVLVLSSGHRTVVVDALAQVLILQGCK